MSGLVHTHGPAEGRGLDCPERLVDGQLRGACWGNRVDLRATAEAATPGPWGAHVLGSEGYDVRSEAPHPRHRLRRWRIARFGYEDWDTDKANAQYVATFDPPTVLALLEELDRLDYHLSEAQTDLDNEREFREGDNRRSEQQLAQLRDTITRAVDCLVKWNGEGDDEHSLVLAALIRNLRKALQ